MYLWRITAGLGVPLGALDLGLADLHYERGVQPLTDITMLRRFARALTIPPQVIGLTPQYGTRTVADTPAPLRKNVSPAPAGLM
jgi:hypothetical protein